MEHIEIIGGRYSKENIEYGDSWNYTISYCGKDKEGKKGCRFYHINIKAVSEDYFFMKRDGLKELITIRGNWEKVDKRAHSVSKNIAKLFRRDFVPWNLKRWVKILDKTNNAKPSD